jgi:hypothetical protein
MVAGTMPNSDEIERAYTRPRPPPDPGLDGYKKFVTASTTVAALSVFIVGLCIAVCAAADNLLGLGWGYHWRDLWGALAILAGDAILYIACRAWFAFIGFYSLARGRPR